MRAIRGITMLILLAVLIVIMSACGARSGRTDRYETFTVRTEKSESGKKAPSADAVRAMPENGAGEDFVLNKSSMKFHYPECSGVSGIKEENRLDYHGTRESVLDMGYAPCKICNP